MDQQAREQAFMAALTTEHFVLQSSAATTVSESGTRASLYVMALSSSLVAVGFAVGSKRAFVPLVATVLPVVFLLGIFTVVRLVETGVQNLLCLRRIAQIRRYYQTLVPEAPAFFGALDAATAATTPTPTAATGAGAGTGGDLPGGDNGHTQTRRLQPDDDRRAALAMLAISRRHDLLTGLFSIAAMVAAINSIVGGAGVALLVAKLLGAAQGPLAVGLGVLAAVVIMVVSVAYQGSRYQVLFGPPSPPAPLPPEPGTK